MGENGSGFAIVGIGASAGGLEAMQAFFEALPRDSGLAYVVITHLSPNRESLLVEILARYTAMPVAQTGHDLEVRPDHVYVAPPGQIVTMNGGRLHHRPNAGEGRERNPIDVFFASLAEDVGERAIGVVLSGSGADGSLGVKAIKEYGGLTLAQTADHTAPTYDDMPTSAISTGLVDLGIPVQEMGPRIVQLAHDLPKVQEAAREEGPDRLEGMRKSRSKINELLRKHLNHDFGGYKETTFIRRVQRRMQVLGLTSHDAYVERLNQNQAELQLLFRDLLINVTAFFRDADAFSILEKQVVPLLFDGKGGGDTVRVWVPGCSTGEEVYSLAILLKEYATTLHAAPKIQIFATDIDDPALSVARAGHYPETLLSGVSDRRRHRFFRERAGSFTVTKEVRDVCIFSPHSVIRDPPFSRMDLISCRNLLIYFGSELQDQVVPVFHYALRPSGFLFLGASENVTKHADLFAPFEKKQRIYRRRDSGGARRTVPLPPANRGSFLPDDWTGSTPMPSKMRNVAESRILERFAPPHVVVDREGNVVHYSGRTGKYLEQPSGMPSRQILNIARGGLYTNLRSVLRRAVEKGEAVRQEGAPLDIDGVVHTVSLEVEPVRDVSGEQYYLIVFLEDVPWFRERDDGGRKPSAPPGVATSQHQQELGEVRERLQSMVEEHETAVEELKSANEELTSLNEELQSTNEELQTSKEELQSVNEEMQTINQELIEKVDELNRARSDMEHLFASAQIGTLFLTEYLTIRSFTPSLTAVFRLIESDRGRPLTDITTELDYPELVSDMRAVLAVRQPIERRVQQRGDLTWYLVRIFPYRNLSGEADGVALTVVDVTRVVEAEEQQRQLVAELNHRVKNMLTVVIAIAQQTLSPAPSAAAVEGFLQRIHALARAYALVTQKGWGKVDVRDLVRDELAPHALDGQERFSLAGPRVLVPATVALGLGMIVHELATNAVKYGALSMGDGRLDLAWQVDEVDGGSRLELTWVERDGPVIGVPERQGFGLKLIQREAAYTLGGDVAFEFLRDGLKAKVSLPLVG